MQHSFGRLAGKCAAVLAAAALAAASCLALSGCDLVRQTEMDSSLTPTVEGTATITSGTLTVGVNGGNTPYGGSNSSNETIGLDVDLAAALADELGLELQIVDVSSNGRSALADGQVDVVLGATKSGTDDTVTYSSAYINDGASLFCLAGNEPESISSLDFDSSAIIVQSDTTAANTVQEAVGIENISATSTMQEAFEALVAGEQTYLVADAVIGSYFARNYEDVVRVDYISASAVTPMYALTLTENTELTAAVTAAVETVTNNGQLRVIESKWLGSEGEALLPGNADTSSLPETAFGLWG